MTLRPILTLSLAPKDYGWLRDTTWRRKGRAELLEALKRVAVDDDLRSLMEPHRALFLQALEGRLTNDTDVTTMRRLLNNLRWSLT